MSADRDARGNVVLDAEHEAVLDALLDEDAWSIGRRAKHGIDCALIELRRLRAETRGLTEDLRSLRADIMAVAAGGAVRWTKHAMGKAGLAPERRTMDNTPCTCGEANTQEKGRHDDDCPSVGL